MLRCSPGIMAPWGSVQLCDCGSLLSVVLRLLYHRLTTVRISKEEGRGGSS